MKIKRKWTKWTKVPRWVDYSAQVLSYVAYAPWLPQGLSGYFQNWSIKLVDRYCNCERCADRDRVTPGWRRR